MSRGERGSVTPLIIGFAAFLAMGIAVVVDATAAYLQRSGLSSLADGAALYGADLGATGQEVYAGGLGAERLQLSAPEAGRAVEAYLRETGAHDRFPGLRHRIEVDPVAGRVVVRLSAPLDLPLSLPGFTGTTDVGATGSAVVRLDPPG